MDVRGCRKIAMDREAAERIGILRMLDEGRLQAPSLFSNELLVFQAGEMFCKLW